MASDWDNWKKLPSRTRPTWEDYQANIKALRRQLISQEKMFSKKKSALDPLI